jgi:hypothetical protein
MNLRRTLTLACAGALGLALSAVPAQAAAGDAVATGDAGAATIGDTVVPPVAACATGSTPQAAGPDAAVPGVVSYADGRSQCAIDDAGEIATVTVTGGQFRLDALRPYGGPTIRLSGYTANCETTLTGAGSSFHFSGLSGVSVPSEIPANYVVTIPGGPDGKPMAAVTFNETHVPISPDGSMTAHLMHVRLFPEGGPTTGDAYVGTVHCAPVS